jgi:hypothetical protein
MEQSTRGRGRPPKPEHERRRGNLTFRVRDRLRYRLEAYAKRDGRSLSEEIEQRLERSLNEEMLLFGLEDPSRFRHAIQTITMVLSGLELQTGRKAFGPNGDPWLHEQAWKAVSTWFAATQPPGEVVRPAGLSPNRYAKAPPPKVVLNALGSFEMTSKLTEPRGIPNLADFNALIEFVAELRKEEKLTQPPPDPKESKEVFDLYKQLEEELKKERDQ